ncbi:MAG: prolipoprotein diacylglyceryl transferase family protein, partial [Solirubrobacteraceae bacterium]
FNQELFGAPSSLPWALRISRAHRVAELAPKYWKYATFEPTFLYELIWNLLLATFLVWLGKHRKIKAPGLVALYVAGYSGFRIFEETQRIDYSEYFLGLRLNFFIATILCLLALAWFVALQRGWRGWGTEPADPVPENLRASGPTRGLGFPRPAAATTRSGASGRASAGAGAGASGGRTSRPSGSSGRGRNPKPR